MIEIKSDLIGKKVLLPNGEKSIVSALHIYCSKKKLTYKIAVKNYYTRGFAKWYRADEIIIL